MENNSRANQSPFNIHTYMVGRSVSEYVNEIYQTMIKTPRQELKQLEEELKQQVPEPMHSLLEKELREAAIQKHKSRKLKATVIVPPTCKGKWLALIAQAYIYNYKHKIRQCH